MSISTHLDEINEAKTNELQNNPKFIKYVDWLKTNGALFSNVITFSKYVFHIKNWQYYFLK